MDKILYIADFFVEHINGGAEQNDSELLSIFQGRGIQVTKIQAKDVSGKFLQENLDIPVIISNFATLSSPLKYFIRDNMNYILYIHDHLYLLTRDPALYENFTAPKEELCNVSFFQKAKAVFVQSIFHKSIVDRNLDAVNTISVGGNLWSSEALEFLEGLSSTPKKKVTSVMLSPINHKNSKGAIKWCESNNLDYEVIAPCSHFQFLEKLAQNEMLAFFPLTPETLSRIVVEARMMGCKVATSRDVGALHEDWSSLKGIDLINVMRGKRNEIPEMVLKVLDENYLNRAPIACESEI